MNLILRHVDAADETHTRFLYQLLSERTQQQSISHRKMQSYLEHCLFVASEPYKAWYIIKSPVSHDFVGSIYLTKQNEIGIFISQEKRGLGLAKAAIEKLMRLYDGPFLANINPQNQASIDFFEKMGFKQLQVTYVSE